MQMEISTRDNQGMTVTEVLDTLPDEVSNGDPLDILLVEDTAADTALVKRSLTRSQESYILQTLQKGNEVMPHLLHMNGIRKMPDLIILDLGLPGMDGFDVLDIITHSSMTIRSIPILVLTGYAQFDYLWKSHPAGVIACMKKPCDVTAMKEVLRKIRKKRSSGAGA